ncbi:MAG TPA: hypothetical protein VK604_10645 [Bryobacteraceae bacterium]|nr:hypothetical protein [Bryobacteraceae bacterium]
MDAVSLYTLLYTHRDVTALHLPSPPPRLEEQVPHSAAHIVKDTTIRRADNRLNTVHKLNVPRGKLVWIRSIKRNQTV